MYGSAIYTLSQLSFIELADSLKSVFGLGWHDSSETKVIFYEDNTPDMGELYDLTRRKPERPEEDWDWMDFVATRSDIDPRFSYATMRQLEIEAKSEALLWSCVRRIAEVLDPVYCRWGQIWMTGPEILTHLTPPPS